MRTGMFAVTQHEQLAHGVSYFFPRVLLVDWRMFHVSPCRVESTVITEFVLNAQLFKLCDIVLCVCVCGWMRSDKSHQTVFPISGGNNHICVPGVDKQEFTQTSTTNMQ